MAQFNLGQVSIVPRGAYNSSSTYNKLDCVLSQGGYFICKVDGTQGIEPGVTSGWTSNWGSTAVGIKSVEATADGADVTFTFRFSNTTSATATVAIQQTTVADGVISTAKLANGAVATAKLANGAVTAAKLGSDIKPVYVSTSKPTTSSADGVYLVTG